MQYWNLTLLIGFTLNHMVLINMNLSVIQIIVYINTAMKFATKQSRYFG